MVREAVPELVTVNDWDAVCPSTTLPKSMLAGLTDNCGWLLTAVAERLTTPGVLPESPVAVNVPERFPAALGFTATVKLAAWPTASGMGVLIPVMLN